MKLEIKEPKNGLFSRPKVTILSTEEGTIEYSGECGLNNVTDADGLAVGSPSDFVGKTLEQMISGVYTVQDETLYKLLRIASDVEKISLEPSALAGMPGAYRIFHTTEGERYLENYELRQHMPNATHIVWATGGSMVPPDAMEAYYRKGVNIRKIIM